MDQKKLRRAPALIAAAAVLPVLLGACGSSSAASSGSGTAPAGKAQFAQCMRQKGVTNFPDPRNGHFLITRAAENNPHFTAAEQACQHFLGPGGVGSNQNNGTKQAQLAFAQCMQTHGVPNFPEPSANGAIEAPQGKGIDTNSPTYQKAFNECRSKLPGNGKGLRSGTGNGQ